MSDDINKIEEEERSAEMESTPECSSCAEYKLGWQRALADYTNLQKETERGRSEWIKMSEAQILEEFLPVHSNFKKAFLTPSEETESQFGAWKKGIEYIMKQFGDILKAHGIEEIKTVGETFDPVRHEAVGEEQNLELPDHSILREVDAGYAMGAKILKVAKVIVNTLET